MSDQTKISARPVSLITIVFLAVLFAAFYFVVRHFYAPTAVAPQNAAAENLPKDLQWRASAESRRAALSDLRATQTKKENSYAWIDQKAGVVRIPVDRAMELLAQRGLPARTGTEAVAGVPNTGPPSGGPQTGSPTPRATPQQPVPGLDLGASGTGRRLVQGETR